MYICKHLYKYSRLAYQLLFKINLFKKIREEVKDDFNVLSKIFHKHISLFFINYEAVSTYQLSQIK